MYLIQLLLPLYDNEQKTFPQREFARVRLELTECFGGMTAYIRSPARGLWKEDANRTVRDDIVIYEVMVEHIDRNWWHKYRADLCARFRQEQLIVRASEMEML